MYTQKSKECSKSERPKLPFQWIKRKILLIISALMIGMSNAIYDEDKSIFGKQNEIEQKHKEE